MIKPHIKKLIETQLIAVGKLKDAIILDDWTDNNYMENQVMEKDPEPEEEVADTEKDKKDKKAKKKLSPEQIKQKRERELHAQLELAIDIYKREYKIVKNTISKRNRILEQTTGFHDSKAVIEFYDLCNSISDIHLSRVNSYETLGKELSSDTNFKNTEIDFINLCSTNIFDIILDLEKFDLETNFNSDSIRLHENTPFCPLIMYEAILVEYPEIQQMLDEMDIDFDKTPKNFMHIYNKDAPVWNGRRHYFEQDKETLQYYAGELFKIRNGVKFGDVHIQPWMYFHLNYFKASIPTTVKQKHSDIKDSKDVIMEPPLRDNEWYIIQEVYTEARRLNKMIFIAATRRFSKTTLIASHLHWSIVSGKRAILIASSTKKDLGNITSMLKISMSAVNRAFYVYTLETKWSEEVIVGIKTKSGYKIEVCKISIVNLEGGVDSASEKLAGYGPEAFVYDEVMKSPFRDQLDAVLPAIMQSEIWKCIPILSGTGGNEDLSRDAMVALKNPENNYILPMNWDWLNKYVNPEDRTWKEQKFGVFAPVQMSHKTGMKKLQKTLAEYLKVVDPELSKVVINVTDWAGNKERNQEHRDSIAGNRESSIKDMVYFPFSPEEIFISSKITPFPVDVAKRHLEYIRSNGLTGRKVRIDYLKDGSIEFKDSYDPLPQFPNQSPFFDAPIVLFADVPKDPPPYLFVSSLDDYKQESSDSPSLACFYVFKRQSGNDPMGNRIVATLTSRPNPHRKLHIEGHQLIKAFRAECLMENEDMDFKLYLDELRETDMWLVPSFNMKGNVNIIQNQHRNYGISPRGNRSSIISRVVLYCTEIVDIVDEYGNVRKGLGVERINDELLLEEIINYNEGLNVDRITSFGICLIQALNLDNQYIPPPVMNSTIEDVEYKRPQDKLVKTTFGRGSGTIRIKKNPYRM